METTIFIPTNNRTCINRIIGYDIEDLVKTSLSIKKESLWNVDLSRVEYQNKYCTIRMGVLIRKKTFRGNTKIGG